MIRGMHGMFYTSEPDQLRAFFRDKLGFSGFDVGEGWLIFDLPESDIGFHPADPVQGAASGTPHLSFYCDDINETVSALRSRGVEFAGEPQDHGYGYVTQFHVPGGFQIQLYQPKYSKGPKAKRRAPKPKPARRAKAKPKATARPKAAPARKKSSKKRSR